MKKFIETTLSSFLKYLNMLQMAHVNTHFLFYDFIINYQDPPVEDSFRKCVNMRIYIYHPLKKGP